MHQLACHLAGSKEVGGALLFPMRCSSTMNSVIKRYDNMVLFARQGTSSQGYFMRQVTIKQFPDLGKCETSQLDVPSECTGKVSAACGHKSFSSMTGEDPIFSKPVAFEQGSSGSLEIQQQQQQNIQSAAARTPLFAKPTLGGNTTREGRMTGQQINHFNGLEWSPRMDVAESRSAYIITIELPGVSALGIRVEVDDKSLIVTGKRSTEWWGNGNGKSAVYHKRELSHGPYHVVWQLPDNSNRDGVSAEFVDGFLQITIPKQDE